MNQSQMTHFYLQVTTSNTKEERRDNHQWGEPRICFYERTLVRLLVLVLVLVLVVA
jgi:hypothetical protein